MSTHKIVQILVTVAICHPQDITGAVRVLDGCRVCAVRVWVHTHEDIEGVVALIIRAVHAGAFAAVPSIETALLNHDDERRIN